MRNAVAHDNTAKLLQLAASGFTLNRALTRRWHHSLDFLAASMDDVVASYLGALLGGCSAVVSNESPDQQFEPGDLVAVPWGLDVLEGTVVSVRGAGQTRQVVVSVDLPDTDDESRTQLVTLPASSLQDAAAVASERRPGSWLPAYRYEEELRSALVDLFQADPELSSLGREHFSGSDMPWDFILDAGDRKLFIEVKSSATGPVSRRTVDLLLRHLSAAHSRTALLVADSGFAPGARERLHEASEAGYRIRTVRWKSPDDNASLDQVIRELLSAA
jgi:hypothetical protein